jgi:hypothetical protein
MSDLKARPQSEEQKRRRAAALQSKDGEIKSPLQTKGTMHRAPTNDEEEADPSLRSG